MNGRLFNKKYFIPITVCLFLVALFIKNSSLASIYTKKGLEICFLTIVPSLFPLMVVSDALCEFGFFDFLGKYQGNISKKLFGLSKCTFTAVLSGLILGFPVGARALISLYDNKKISKSEFKQALGYSGIPSFAFLSNAVGASIFGSAKFGIYLYFCAIASALITGIIFKKNVYKDTRECERNSYRRKPISKIITSAISSSASSTVILCAYVVFFSAVVGCLSESAYINETKKAIISSFLELSTGTLNSGNVGGVLGAVICGACVGWSGLSVHFQTMSLCEDRITDYKIYILEKAMQSVFCGILSLFYALVFGIKNTSQADVSTFLMVYKIEYSALMIVIFIFAFIYITKKSVLHTDIKK